eukprot:Gb_01799 [translate_table: standard]
MLNLRPCCKNREAARIGVKQKLQGHCKWVPHRLEVGVDSGTEFKDISSSLGGGRSSLWCRSGATEAQGTRCRPSQRCGRRRRSQTVNNGVRKPTGSREKKRRPHYCGRQSAGELWKKTPSECADQVYLSCCWLMFGAMLSTEDELPMKGNVDAEVSLKVFASWPSSHMSGYRRADGGG